MDLGEHAAFIWASYGVVAIVVAAVIGWLIWDGRRYAAQLRQLEEAGVTRRSAHKRTSS